MNGLHLQRGVAERGEALGAAVMKGLTRRVGARHRAVGYRH